MNIIRSPALATASASRAGGALGALRLGLRRRAGPWHAVCRGCLRSAAANSASAQERPGPVRPDGAQVDGGVDARGQFAFPSSSSSSSSHFRSRDIRRASTSSPWCAAPVAPLGAGEAWEGAALGARPIPWTSPRAPTASLPAPPPPAATGASCARTAVVAATLPLLLLPARSIAAAQRLQETLLLGVLLAEGLKDLAKLAVVASASPSAERAACTPLPPLSAAHLWRRGMMRGEQIRCGGHPEKGARGTTLAPCAAMPRRLTRPLRRGAAAGCGPRGGPRQPGGRDARRRADAVAGSAIVAAGTRVARAAAAGREAPRLDGDRRAGGCRQMATPRWIGLAPARAVRGGLHRRVIEHPPSERCPDPLDTRLATHRTARKGDLCR